MQLLREGKDYIAKIINDDLFFIIPELLRFETEPKDGLSKSSSVYIFG